MTRSLPLKVFCLVIPVLAASGYALAQSTTTVTYPQDNVSGSALASRRPGQLVDNSISAHVTRMDSVLHAHGGAAPQETTQTDRHTVFLGIILQNLFDTLQQLVNALALAAQLPATTATST